MTIDSIGQDNCQVYPMEKESLPNGNTAAMRLSLSLYPNQLNLGKNSLHIRLRALLSTVFEHACEVSYKRYGEFRKMPIVPFHIQRAESWVVYSAEIERKVFVSFF